MLKQPLTPDDVEGHSSFYQFHNGTLRQWQSLLSGNGHNQKWMPVGHNGVQEVKQRTLDTVSLPQLRGWYINGHC